LCLATRTSIQIRPNVGRIHFWPEMKPNERTEPSPWYPTRLFAMSHIAPQPSSHSYAQPCGNHGANDARTTPRVLERHGCPLPSFIFFFLHHIMQGNNFIVLFAACCCVSAVVLGTKPLQGATQPKRSRGQTTLPTPSMSLWINTEGEIHGPTVPANLKGPPNVQMVGIGVKISRPPCHPAVAWGLSQHPGSRPSVRSWSLVSPRPGVNCPNALGYLPP
jgi:hypothetical protein